MSTDRATGIPMSLIAGLSKFRFATNPVSASTKETQKEDSYLCMKSSGRYDSSNDTRSNGLNSDPIDVSERMVSSRHT